jgi:hypothetical protein
MTSQWPWTSAGFRWAQASLRIIEKLSKYDGCTRASAPARADCFTASST